MRSAIRKPNRQENNETSITIDESKKLPREFYVRPTLTVAREVLGKIFVRRIGKITLAGRIVEVEAYHQDGDASSHSSRGKTQRNEVMFRQGGFLYVYFTYGMHFCMNIATEGEGVGAAVLLRGIEPLLGWEVMRKNRGDHISLHNLTNGPAKCTQAFQIARRENGVDLCGENIFLLDAPRIAEEHVLRTERIGIRASTDLKWRFFVKGNAWVSK